MAADVNNGGIRLEGFDDLIGKLRAVPIALRKKTIRNALAVGGRIVRDDARKNVAVLSTPVPYRTRGLLKKSIAVRTSKAARRSGDVGVFINVKPAKGANRGARSRTDPFYWRFVEFGTQKMAARPFLKRAANKFPQALDAIQTALRKWFDKTNATGRVVP
jgi:HK97 gp10 family phage protein